MFYSLETHGDILGIWKATVWTSLKCSCVTPPTLNAGGSKKLTVAGHQVNWSNSQVESLRRCGSQSGFTWMDASAHVIDPVGPVEQHCSSCCDASLLGPGVSQVVFKLQAISWCFLICFCWCCPYQAFLLLRALGLMSGLKGTYYWWILNRAKHQS